MTTAGEIYAYIDRFAPFHTAMDFDNPGLLVGDQDAPVTSVLLALDITAAVVKEAEKAGCQLIVSHHPVIFHPLKRLGSHDAPYLLAKAGISAVCAHTNLDLAEGGVNTCLADRLELGQVRPLKEYENTGLAEGLIGSLERELSPELFAEFVKEKLGCGGLKYTCGRRAVKTVALCGGAGAYLLYDAVSAGADAFVTADTKHHELLAADELGLTLVDAGHFCTEDVVIEPLLEKLRSAFPSVKFQKSGALTDPAKYL